MNNLIALLKRYQHILAFLLLEVVALTLHFSYGYERRAHFGLLFKRVEASIDAKSYELRHYMGLREENQRLVAENLELRNALEGAHIQLRRNPAAMPDSVLNDRYVHRSARVISNSVVRQQNYFTIDQGTDNGVRENMPVLTEGCVAGIIVATSPRYAIAISLLNTELKVSAKLTRTGYYGSLSWDGESYRTALLSEIPHHVEVLAGDTVVTSGYSNIFPAGVAIGRVERVEHQGGDFSTLRVRLETDFKRLHYVTVLEDKRRDEVTQLQAERGTDGE